MSIFNAAIQTNLVMKLVSDDTFLLKVHNYGVQYLKQLNFLLLIYKLPYCINGLW